MFGLLNQLKNKFKKPAEPATVAHLPRKPGVAAAVWTEAEIEAILACERSGTPLDVRLELGGAIYRTRILGADIAANQLLLDAMHPAPPVSYWAGEQPFWLYLPTATGELRLCVQPREILPQHQAVADILLVREIAPFASAGADTGVTFNRSAPPVLLTLQNGQKVAGRLGSLSAHGAEILLATADSHAFRLGQERIRCTIEFNEHFKLQCIARAPSACRSRRGTRDSALLSLTLTHMDAAQHMLLQAYLQACQEQSQQAA